MAGPRPALVRRARRLLGYWRSETRTLRQGLVALVISTAAGFVAAAASGLGRAERSENLDSSTRRTMGRG